MHYDEGLSTPDRMTVCWNISITNISEAKTSIVSVEVHDLRKPDYERESANFPLLMGAAWSEKARLQFPDFPEAIEPAQTGRMTIYAEVKIPPQNAAKIAANERAEILSPNGFDGSKPDRKTRLCDVAGWLEEEKCLPRYEVIVSTARGASFRLPLNSPFLFESTY
ncbi:hypothetical protein [Candidatus Burkholderia verschuerenii]|uniref:hypothetical protein n=1 Tax=Candidatus Burkholderia verschuerenii TaxID=242163 RepID=UPI00067C46D9|nr:hypothetical protein [Candidatus Burkholderia verschuerenii]